MGFMASELGHAGFASSAPSYGMRRSMDEILDYVAPKAAAFEATLDGPMHFVTHSLGGLVARALIHRQRPQRLGRVVQLGPPNQGSELADALTDMKLSSMVLGPVAPYLRTQRPEANEAMFGKVDYELGVVAGDVSVHLVPESILPRPNDGKVSVAATRLDGMADHIVIHVAHSMLPFHPDSVAQVLAFLADGRFRHKTAAAG